MSQYVMKAISLKQPWAWLVAIGLKEFETRSWRTNHRGPLAIHASKRIDALDLEAVRQNKALVKVLEENGIRVEKMEEHLALGKIVALVNLYEVVKADGMMVSEAERAFGDFGPGRYAWRFDAVVELYQPVPVIGAMGLWNWTIPEVVKPMMRQAFRQLKHWTEGARYEA